MKTWKNIPFGKHQGKTLRDIAFDDPDYVLWFSKQDNLCQEYLEDLKFLFQRLTRIKIPPRFGSEFEVEIVVNPLNHKFDSIAIVPKSRTAGTHAHRFRNIDLFAPSKISSYDKCGGKMMIKFIKKHVFGNASTRLTPKIIEALLADHSNFDLEMSQTPNTSS